MSPLDASYMLPSENRGSVGGCGSGGGSAVGSTNDGPSHDEILIQYLILNPCLWDKSNAGFRNRSLKDAKWKEIASRIRMSGEYMQCFCSGLHNFYFKFDCCQHTRQCVATKRYVNAFVAKPLNNNKSPVTHQRGVYLRNLRRSKMPKCPSGNRVATVERRTK